MSSFRPPFLLKQTLPPSPLFSIEEREEKRTTQFGQGVAPVKRFVGGFSSVFSRNQGSFWGHEHAKVFRISPLLFLLWYSRK
jgi:hypothetical protein